MLYDREVPFELRQHNADGHQEVGTLEAIKVKILVMGDEPVPVALRIELTRYVADSSLAFVSCEKTQRRISGYSSGVLGLRVGFHGQCDAARTTYFSTTHTISTSMAFVRSRSSRS